MPQITTNWAKFTVVLTTSSVTPIESTRFVVSTSNPGTFWLTHVSLFPPTYRDRPNGNRMDLMRKMADLKPSFLRMPGYSGSGIYEGRGGASKNVNGVDIWLVGTPLRKIRIIGYIMDS